MEKSIKMHNGSTLAKYEETDEKKQMLWDAFIKWCEKNSAWGGECMQSDDFVIESPNFMADALDNIVKFELEDLD